MNLNRQQNNKHQIVGCLDQNWASTMHLDHAPVRRNHDVNVPPEPPARDEQEGAVAAQCEVAAAAARESARARGDRHSLRCDTARSSDVVAHVVVCYRADVSVVRITKPSVDQRRDPTCGLESAARHFCRRERTCCARARPCRSSARRAPARRGLRGRSRARRARQGRTCRDGAQCGTSGVGVLSTKYVNIVRADISRLLMTTYAVVPRTATQPPPSCESTPVSTVATFGRRREPFQNRRTLSARFLVVKYKAPRFERATPLTKRDPTRTAQRTVARRIQHL